MTRLVCVIYTSSHELLSRRFTYEFRVGLRNSVVTYEPRCIISTTYTFGKMMNYLVTISVINDTLRAVTTPPLHALSAFSILLICISLKYSKFITDNENILFRIFKMRVLKLRVRCQVNKVFTQPTRCVTSMRPRGPKAKPTARAAAAGGSEGNSEASGFRL